MFNTDLLITLNSKNVSMVPSKTKERVGSILAQSTKQQRDRAAALGGYNDARSFNKTKSSGFISVRMALTLAIIFNLDPNYIIAETDERTEYSDEKAKRFLINMGFKHVLSKEYGPTEEDVIPYISKLMRDISPDMKESIRRLSEEELLTMLKAYLIRSKIGADEEIRLFLIKILLIGGRLNG
ncbi:MAG: hypothetical protein K0S61_305 [Anaerocolumna sp.]|jgi:hypothetical protein|nr:hypothetical protein [Anaerocolumna sp.]